MRLEHIGVIVKHQRQLDGLKQLLGMSEVERGRVEKYDAECVMLEGHGFRIECIFSEYGPLAEYNGGRGGIHHIAVELEEGEDLPEGTPLLEETPTDGICEMKVNFVPPLVAGFPVEIVRRGGGDG
jgi:lactoylglutathione lyase/methylmalonyl-CoA/ethylmalonyl-CoA epimerase